MHCIVNPGVGSLSTVLLPLCNSLHFRRTICYRSLQMTSPSLIWPRMMTSPCTDRRWTSWFTGTLKIVEMTLSPEFDLVERQSSPTVFYRTSRTLLPTHQPLHQAPPMWPVWGVHAAQSCEINIGGVAAEDWGQTLYILETVGHFIVSCLIWPKDSTCQ